MFRRLQTALAIRTRTILLSLKNLIAPIVTKLQSKSFYCPQKFPNPTRDNTSLASNFTQAWSQIAYEL